MTKDEARKMVRQWLNGKLEPEDFADEILETLIAEPEYLDLKTHPLDSSMVGMWAWVRLRSGFSAVSEVVDIRGEAKFLDRGITHYSLIGSPPEFKK